MFQIQTNSENYKNLFDPSLLQSSCLCCISCHFLTQRSTNSSKPLSDSSSVMIYDLHTLLHKHTQTHNQLTHRQKDWSGDDRRGCTRSVSWLAVWLVWCREIENKGGFIIGKPIAGTTKGRKEKERKKENKEWCLQLCSYYSENAITTHPVCVQLGARHIKAHRLCLIILEHL